MVTKTNLQGNPTPMAKSQYSYQHQYKKGESIPTQFWSEGASTGMYQADYYELIRRMALVTGGGAPDLGGNDLERQYQGTPEMLSQYYATTPDGIAGSMIEIKDRAQTEGRQWKSMTQESMDYLFNTYRERSAYAKYKTAMPGTEQLYSSVFDIG